MTRRVYEVAEELGVESADLLAWLQGRGHAVRAHMAAFPEGELEAAREVLMAHVVREDSVEDRTEHEGERGALGVSAARVGEEHPASSSTGRRAVGEERYRLVRKGSVTVPGVCRVVKGETVGRGVYERLPRRVRRWFEVV